MNIRDLSARPGVARAACRGFSFAVAAALIVLSPTRSYAQNISYSEFKFGLWDHDTHLLGGKEQGADINPELIIASPVTDDMVAGAPGWIRWTLQPRPTIGAAFNTSGDTDQAYLGATWSWMLVNNIIRPGDGLVLGYFFGLGLNDGKLNEVDANRQALGSHELFREAFDLGYQINATWEISAYIDHISNGGLQKYNQSINDLGLRLGYRF